MSYTYPVPDYSANIEKSLKIPTECLKKKGQGKICKTLHRKLKLEQHEPH
jgi:hypothetical protein